MDEAAHQSNRSPACLFLFQPARANKCAGGASALDAAFYFGGDCPSCGTQSL